MELSYQNIYTTLANHSINWPFFPVKCPRYGRHGTSTEEYATSLVGPHAWKRGRRISIKTMTDQTVALSLLENILALLYRTTDCFCDYQNTCWLQIENRTVRSLEGREK